jgi:hypothetical protein
MDTNVGRGQATINLQRSITAALTADPSINEAKYYSNYLVDLLAQNPSIRSRREAEDLVLHAIPRFEEAVAAFDGDLVEFMDYRRSGGR